MKRFVVMCSYQPDTLTVRASFSVPSKSGSPSPMPMDNPTDRESRRRSFRMVGKDALLLKQEKHFENLSEEQNNNVPIGEGFVGDISEVRKQRGVNENEIDKQSNATFDRLVYNAQLPKNESNYFV